MAAFTSSWCCDELREWLWIIKVYSTFHIPFYFINLFAFFLPPSSAPPTHHHLSNIEREWIKKDINDGNEKNISLWFCSNISCISSEQWNLLDFFFFLLVPGNFFIFSSREFFFPMESFYSFVIRKIFLLLPMSWFSWISITHKKVISKADTFNCFPAYLKYNLMCCLRPKIKGHWNVIKFH